ncbi:HAD-IA family hydrolase [uncultured Azohydromonas sp.]|jgi:haloacid dehalogenase superfamily, subfamily IA, variant 3 with third motif having DD or ED|uniref:HAD family hydrolase n=1 Tax=uncultured Azohydromonas sp. TaxID=487342 RepID=UPI002616EBC0|nr:HAD-IA family hydrolase [uncultured Azohydromonas sp.]
MTSFDAVIFDCDGTLVDSEPILLATVEEQALALGVAPALLADLHEMKGQSMALTLATIGQRRGRPLPEDFEATVRARMAETLKERLQPMPGARALLRRLALPFCVATNGPRAKTELTLSITGLLPLLRPDRIFSAYEVGAFKPDPALFLHAARALGVAPGRCAVVEDSPSGVRAGLAAGMQVHVLRSAQPLPTELHARVRHLDALEELLDTG